MELLRTEGISKSYDNRMIIRNLNIYRIVDNRKNLNRTERSLALSICIKWRNSYKSVHTVL